jgi:ribonuclease-3
MGKGENLSGGRNKASILADAYEALVGALFFDSNLETVSRVFMPMLINEVNKCKESSTFKDYKSDLQEYTQNKFVCIPAYQVVREAGPDHDKRFEVSVAILSEIQGTGSGRSKKEAEQNAAQMALEKYLSQPD